MSGLVLIHQMPASAVLVGGLCGGSIAWSAAWLWRHSRATHRQRQERYPDWEPSPLWEGYRDPPGWWSDDMDP